MPDKVFQPTCLPPLRAVRAAAERRRGLGGLLGSVVRYKAGGWVLHLTMLEKFPYSTFAVNIVGCLAVGILAGLVEKHDFFTADTRLFLFTGLLGGFTTFSAFGLDTIYLLRRGEFMTAASYAGLSVLIGVAAVWLGFKLIASWPHHA
jgi:CrcB protein